LNREVDERFFSSNARKFAIRRKLPKLARS
jgi:hypothetical protein